MISHAILRQKPPHHELVTVNGYQVGPLFVHRSLSAGAVMAKTWTISHPRSGHAIVKSIRLYRVAMNMAQDLAVLNGWDRATALIKKDRKLERAVKNIASAYGYWWAI